LLILAQICGSGSQAEMVMPEIWNCLNKWNGDRYVDRVAIIVRENVCNKAKKRQKSRFLDFEKKRKKRKSNDA